MPATVEQELRELLITAEDDDDVADIRKVRALAVHGVPASLRARVWKYLLLGTSDSSHDSYQDEYSTSNSNNVPTLVMDDWKSVSSSRSSNSSSRGSSRASPISDEYDLEVVKKVRGDIQRYERKIKGHYTPESFIVLENVIRQFMDRNRNIEYSSVMIYMAGPLVCALRHEQDVYAVFERMWMLIDVHQKICGSSMVEQVAQFMSIFRTVDPELYEYFEGEEVLSGQWASGWLTGMFAREMCIPNILRLWDIYFSQGWSIHPYVCLAVLRMWRDTLEELENSEIVSFLKRLPSMDIDQIYHDAMDIMDDRTKLSNCQEE